MADTTDYNLTGDWSLVADGKANVLVQQLGSSPVAVHVGAAAPAAGAAAIVMDREEDPATGVLSLSGLAATDKVYVRSFRADKTSRVVVLTGA